jgi:hypothetical protein
MKKGSRIIISIMDSVLICSQIVHSAENHGGKQFAEYSPNLN